MNKILLKKGNKPTKSGLYAVSLYGSVSEGTCLVNVFLDFDQWAFTIVGSNSSYYHYVNKYDSAIWNDEITFEQ